MQPREVLWYIHDVSFGEMSEKVRTIRFSSGGDPTKQTASGLIQGQYSTHVRVFRALPCREESMACLTGVIKGEVGRELVIYTVHLSLKTVLRSPSHCDSTEQNRMLPSLRLCC